MAKPSAATILTSRLLDELSAVRSSGGDRYPITLAQLAARLEPPPEGGAVLKAVAGKAFTGRAVVAAKGRPDSPVAWAEDADLLAESPLTLAAALAAKAVKATPPWSAKQLAATLDKSLRTRFEQVLAEQIAGGRLPPFVVVVTKGKTPQLYHRENPLPPPPLPKEAVLAGRLVEALRGRRAAGPDHYPATVRQLAELTDTAVEGAIFKKALKHPAFAEQVALISWVQTSEPHAALSEDLPTLARSEFLLTSLLAACERVDAHAFPAKALIAELGGPKTKNPLKAATQAFLESDDVDRHLPAGIGSVQVAATKTKGLRHFFRLEHLRTGRPAPSPTREVVGGRPSFAEAFDAAFARLDRASGSNNFVSLVDLRAELPEFPRAEFDAELQSLRRARRYSLKSAEGYDGLSPGERDAAIREEGEYLLHASRVRS